MDSNTEIEQLKKEIETLKREHQKQYEALKRENQSLKQQYDESFVESTHSNELWADISAKCKTDKDFIKSLINDKVLNMTECDRSGRTLLLMAAKCGSYELVQLCLNLGADINKTDKNGRTALELARSGQYTHVEQLLLFSKMNANIGSEIRHIADTIKRQKGITENIMNQLSTYDSTTKPFFENTFIDLMINIIQNQQSFSDDILNVCWKIECNETQNPLFTKLWKTIVAVCKEIVQNGDRKQWFWFKKFILPSTIWFTDISDEQKDEENDEIKRNYLYYELLKLVENKACEQLNELNENLSILSKRGNRNWGKLVSWHVSDEYNDVRQDEIPNGVIAKFTHKDLSEQGSSSAFNAHRFYDYNEYLPQLVLLAHILDDEFQKSVQNIFNIDRYTKIGQINIDSADEKEDNNANINSDGFIEYIQGPVKLIKRAKNKSQNDYNSAAFPTTACVLDFNRCILVFNDISTLLSALNLFQNKVKFYQSGSIIGVIRAKNGFKAYVKEPQYADIKLNVLIRGKHNNIIGEVQFLLKTMKDYKAKAHNLYSIQRQRQFMETSVSSILPLLLNEDKQLFVAGNKGDINELCNLMVINNKSEQDIMKVDDESSESILLNLMDLGHYRAFKFLQDVIPKDLMLNRLFLANRYNMNSIESAIKVNGLLLIKDVLNINEVQQRYQDDKYMMYRLLYCLFVYCDNEMMIDYILKQLDINSRQITEFIGYKCPKPAETFAKTAYKYHTSNIINAMAAKANKVQISQKLENIIGQKAFAHYALASDIYNVNALERAIVKNKLEMLKFMLSIDAILEAYKNTNDLKLQYRLLYWLFCKCDSEEQIDFALNKLSISKERIVKLMSYKYPLTDGLEDTAFKYHIYNIVGRIIFNNSLDKLQKLANIIGNELFIKNVFQPDGYNVTAIEFTIWKNKLDVMKYLMSHAKIKQRCLADKDIMWRMVWRMSKTFNANMVKYIMNELKLDKAKLKEIQSFKCEKRSDQTYSGGWTIWKYEISDEQISNLMNAND